jgi:hypothetical protein
MMARRPATGPGLLKTVENEPLSATEKREFRFLAGQKDHRGRENNWVTTKTTTTTHLVTFSYTPHDERTAISNPVRSFLRRRRFRPINAGHHPFSIRVAFQEMYQHLAKLTEGVLFLA